MKKTEAISILATSVRPREPKDRARYDEAVKMAIEALKGSERTAETTQTDHIADVSKKAEGDCISRQAALDCATYDVEHTIECLKALPSAQPEIIRCKDCKHRHVENMVWTCPFGLPGGENFFCGYGTEPYKGE